MKPALFRQPAPFGRFFFEPVTGIKVYSGASFEVPAVKFTILPTGVAAWAWASRHSHARAVARCRGASATKSYIYATNSPASCWQVYARRGRRGRGGGGGAGGPPRPRAPRAAQCAGIGLAGLLWAPPPPPFFSPPYLFAAPQNAAATASIKFPLCLKPPIPAPQTKPPFLVIVAPAV
jgi:hypothetical protein